MIDNWKTFHYHCVIFVYFPTPTERKLTWKSCGREAPKPQPYIEDSDPLIKKDKAYIRIKKHSKRQKGKTLKFVKKT